MIEILRFINTVALVQFWPTFFSFFSVTKAKSRTLPSYAWAVLKRESMWIEKLEAEFKGLSKRQ